MPNADLSRYLRHLEINIMLFRSTVLAAATSCFAVVQAQYKIDPESVDINQRGKAQAPRRMPLFASMSTNSLLEVWCRNQKETCPKICEQTEPQTTLVNDCDAVCINFPRNFPNILFPLTCCSLGNSYIWLLVRKQSETQYLGVLLDIAVLCLSRMDEPVCR